MDHIMLQDVLPKVRECLEKAAENRRKAEAATDPDMQRFYLNMEARWFGLAESYDHTRRTNEFLNIRPDAEADSAAAGMRELGAESAPAPRSPAATSKRRSGPPNDGVIVHPRDDRPAVREAARSPTRAAERQRAAEGIVATLQRAGWACILIGNDAPEAASAPELSQ
jgi:hypothetical protein